MNAAEWIAQRRELIEAATEGPWMVGGDDWEGATLEMPDDGSGSAVIIAADMHQGPNEGADDAEFIADARTSLPRALNALEAALALAKGHRDWVTKRGRDGCICTICDTCRAIETALRGASVP